jgi:hypothetical protein
MHNLLLRLVRLASILAVLSPSHLLAEGRIAEMVIVADTRQLTGIQAWWANLYNQSHLEFALITVVVIPLAGVILGTVADLLMRLIGIDLKSRTLREE